MFKTIVVLFALVSASSVSAKNWPMFRGAGSSGIAEGYPTPLTWNVATLHNIRWKTPIPGMGHSSPIVWGDQVFVTTAVGQKEREQLRIGLYGDIASADDQETKDFRIYCLDKSTGQILWYRTAHKGIPRVKRHMKSSHANPTMATDGNHLVAFFGSEGLYCYDMQGSFRWSRELGLLDSGFFRAPGAQWGFASSPILHEGMVLVQCDVLSQTFVAAFALADGSEIWRTPRQDVPTWSTPAIYTEGSSSRVVVNGYKCIAGYDTQTGKEIWRLSGGGDIPVPTPLVTPSLIYITNAHGGQSPIYAIRPDARGDITLREAESSNRYIAWSYLQGGAYMQTPLVYGEYLYVCRDNGVLSCFQARTGERIYRERLGDGRSGFSASLVAGDGKIYATSEEGDIYVIAAGADFRILSVNAMDEICMATPALSEGMLLFRTRSHLTAVGKAD